MAEAVISALVEGLASMALEGIKEEVSLIMNVKNDVTKLKSTLGTIQTVIEDAEKRQLADLSVKNWMEKLKDVSFDMVNVLDEWNTADFRLNIAEGSSKDAPVDRRKKAGFSVTSLFSCCSGPATTKQLSFRHDVARQIKDLNARLDEICSEKDKFGFSTATTVQRLERPITTSFVDETEIEGRVKEHVVLVDKLLCEHANDRDRKLTVIPIVGMGGLGKTTMAQLAYNDDRIKAHFEKRIWVCVSDPFDVTMIAKSIIEAVEGKTPKVNELDNLLRSVVECVEGKRFLLVLDDVWNQSKDKWDRLKHPLTCGAAGSRVLITTRKEEVVQTMEATSNKITLDMLSQESCWLIFKRIAFSGRREDDEREFEDIGQKIASKCKGLPLVARMLGSLMRFKETRAQWENVVNNDWWQFKDVEVEEIFTPFLVSYYDLSAVEKQCFLYCSIFPKDHLISRDELIELWMSQSYLSGDSYYEGRQCFENLIMRSFFQNFEKNGFDGSITHCKMHDIVHDFAQFLTGKEYAVVDSGGVTPNEKARHLTLVIEPYTDFTYFGNINSRKICTLYVLSQWNTIAEILNLNVFDYLQFEHLVHLRSLHLFQCRLEKVPDNIGRMIHLRYLDMSQNSTLFELPDALCNLCNLQTLKLKHCGYLQNLPEGIEKLANLRHLYVEGCYSFIGLPKGIGKLKHLQYLDEFIIPIDSKEFFSSGELKSLPNLQLRGSLRIRYCTFLENKDGAEKVDLKSISRDVSDLSLDFHNAIGPCVTISHDETEVLEGLEPHQNLARLKVFHFNGSKLPSWLGSLINLREIKLKECNKCEMLPSCMGNLPFLKFIKISRMNGVKEVGDEFLGVTGGENDPSRRSTSTTVLFPKLKRLQFSFMWCWTRWEGRLGEKMAVVMPCLTHLEFEFCRLLEVLPEFLATVSSLKQVFVSKGEMWSRSRTGSEWDKISHAANIKIEGEYVKQDGVWIQADSDVSE